MFQLECLESFERTVDRLYEHLAREGRGKDLEDLCPYFGVLWPGARLLARWLAEQPSQRFMNTRILEIGCGLALPSLVVARLGAEVDAADMHPDVPRFLERNLSLNHCVGVRPLLWDWRGGDRPPVIYDWILGSDILYDRSHASELVAFLKRCLAPRGQAVIVDPNRSFWKTLVEETQRAGFHVGVESCPARERDEPPLSIRIHIKKDEDRI